MEKRTRTIILIAGLTLILMAAGLIGFSLIGAAGRASTRERANMLVLAGEYIERNDYDRALDILDRLIIKDAADEEARSLRDKALGLKAAGKAELEASAKSGTAGTEALTQTLDQLGRSLERTASTVASTASQTRSAEAIAAEAAARAASEAAARKADEEARARAEEQARAKAEADAMARAEAEAAAARKKAQDEAMAQANAELRKKMEDVNAYVAAGKAAVAANEYGPAKGYFEQAVGGLPSGQAKFAAQTWADIAEGYYDAYKGNPKIGRAHV